jgi:hypothetical protein
MTARFVRFLALAAVLLLSFAEADESSGLWVDKPVPLPEDEQRQVTLSLLERYPELASSPGLKATYAYLGKCATPCLASVVFYPHAEHHGIKEAYEARCTREDSSEAWTCDDVTIRRYLRLATQDYEVRVTGDTSSDTALALIEASRRDLHVDASDAASLPDTAIIIVPVEDGRYLVSWGAPEGAIELTMMAEPEHGGDPANPDDWHARIFDSPGQ